MTDWSLTRQFSVSVCTLYVYGRISRSSTGRFSCAFVSGTLAPVAGPRVWCRCGHSGSATSAMKSRASSKNHYPAISSSYWQPAPVPSPYLMPGTAAGAAYAICCCALAPRARIPEVVVFLRLFCHESVLFLPHLIATPSRSVLLITIDSLSRTGKVRNPTPQLAPRWLFYARIAPAVVQHDTPILRNVWNCSLHLLFFKGCNWQFTVPGGRAEIRKNGKCSLLM